MPSPLAVTPPQLNELVDRARQVAARGGRRLLGVTGPPAAGKSSLADALAAELGAVVVSMDGFHLSDEELRRLHRHERKGAPDTFDAEGFVAILRRLRPGDRLVAAPRFDRSLEQTLPDSVAIPVDVGLVIIEGNYLLMDTAPWGEVRSMLDEVWFIDHPRRLERLVARHIEFGREPALAYERATTGSDGDNARTILSSRDRADLVLDHGWLAP